MNDAIKYFSAILFLLVQGTNAFAELAIKRNPNGSVVVMTGLFDSPEGCHPFDMSGVVVKREFGKDALLLTGIVLESPNGSRTFINVVVEVEKMSMADKSTVLQTLQLFSRIGRQTSLRVWACGAAGRAYYVDGIR